jgi:ESCO1/2 acetyl-transferase
MMPVRECACLEQRLPLLTGRQDMVYGYLLKHDQLAFSPLTKEGLHFAQAYVGRPDVLLYNDYASRR